MEVRQVRTDEIRLAKVDEPAANIRYIGRSDSMRASESDPVWQICRQYRNGDVIISTYALMGEFKCSWTDRTTYFDAAIPDNNNPLDGEIAVTGSFAPSGLRNGGLITEVTLNSSTWTALPATALADRNAVAIQNNSSIDIKINYSSGISGYVGMRIAANGGERFYDIKNNIVLYAKSQSGTPTITVEEIS